MKLISSGEIAKQLGIPYHRVLYAISCLKISPLGKVGGRNIYDVGAVKKIKAKLADMQERRRSSDAQIAGLKRDISGLKTGSECSKKGTANE